MFKLASRVALVVIVAGCAFGGTTSGGVTWCDYVPLSRPGIDENGCLTIPDYYGVPADVVPTQTEESALIVVERSGRPPGGMEGGIFFIRAVTPAGRTVLETQFDRPHAEQAVPAGVYQVTLFERNCSGNCGSLGPPEGSCVVDLLAEPALSYTIHYQSVIPTQSDSSFPITATCSVEDQHYPGGEDVAPVRLQLGTEEYFTIVEVDLAVDTTRMVFQPDAGNVLVAVLVEIEGINPDGAAYGPSFFTLRDDAQGFEYHASPFGMKPQLQSSNDLAPGDTVRGWVNFEVPEAAAEAAAPLVLIYAPGGLSVFPLETSIYPCGSESKNPCGR